MSKAGKTQAEIRKERQAAALRANLKRRKAQARAQAPALTEDADDASQQNSSETAKK